MSYHLFLLLNVNHLPEDLFPYLSEHLEVSGDSRWVYDRSPDVFYSVEYLQEGTDKSLRVDIPFGAEEIVMKDLFDFLETLEAKIQFQLLDPQLGRIIKPTETPEVLEKWKFMNLQALETFSDGHHFLRNIEIRDGGTVMIEAIKFKEETWQNYCSVALAYGRVRQSEKAAALFQRALQLEPENPAVLHAFGVTRFNMGEYQESRELLERSLKLDPDNPMAEALLADCVERTSK